MLSKLSFRCQRDSGFRISASDSSDEFGNVSALLSTYPGGGPIVISGLPTIPVPLASPIVLALLALAFLIIGVAVISRRGRLTLTALVFLGLGGAAAAACVLDGEIFDWSLEDLLAISGASDPASGVDLRALFGKLDTQTSQFCFRIDAALVFSEAPQAGADDYVVVATNLLDEPAGSGLLINDNLGIPDADLIGFGGGNLGGTPADNAPGSTLLIGADGSLTVNADGSFSFQAETGFEGDFEFFYRLENIAGQSDGLVTVEVQSVPVAQDDAFDVVNIDTLSVPAPGVLDNDSGLPDPQVLSFGGGDLGGAPGDNAAGTSVVVGGDGSLTLNADGSLTFAPPSGQTGPFEFDYVIDNPAGNATATVTITINQAPAITSADAFVCSVGNVCTFSFVAEGFPDPTITLAGPLPAGVTFNAATEALEGTPDAGSGAEYVVIVTAANGIGTDAEQTFTLTVNESPTITSADTLGCEVETDCDFNFTADGFPAPTFDLPGLPAGLSLDAVTGVLSGQPDAGTGGQYNLVLEASNSEGTDTQAFTLDIGQAPVITSTDSLTCEVGQPCNFTLTATGFPAPAFALPGLPSGLTLDAISGQLSGMPDPGTGDLYNLTVEASNSVGTDAQAFALTINQAPQITSAASLDCLISQPCSFTVTATGFPAPTFTLPGLPTGLTIDAVSGMISGTPTQSGVFNLTLGADNGVAPADSQAFTLQVGAPPQITSANATTCQVGVACSFAFTASGTPSPTINLTGGLPTGVTFDGGTDSLSGTPQPGSGGNYNLTVEASNGFPPDASQAFVLTVNEGPMAMDDPSGGIPADSSPGSMPYHGAFNTNLVVSAAAGVLANDNLGFPAAAITTPNPVAANGTVSLAADGSFTYSPAAGFTGFDSFQYCIENAATNSCAMVTVAIGERPSAADANYPVTLIGNVPVDTSLSSGFSVLSLAGGDAITVGLDSTLNGDAVVNGDGTFVFDPAAGFSGGNAELIYSAGNGFGTVTGTVTLPVGADRVWFADNALAAAGDGRLSAPFNTMAVLDGAANAVGDVLFVHAGSGAYEGELSLLNDQILVGEATSAALATIAGLSVPADSVLPATGGTAPAIDNAGGNGLTLAANNHIQGFAIGNTSGIGISGSNFGTLTVAEVSITGVGQALSLSNGSVAGAGFGSVSSSSGVRNVLLTAIGGTLNLGNGSLSGATTSGFEVNGGTATINYGGTITSTGTTRPVRVLDRTAGVLTLSGAITGANGILLTNNTGSTVAFAGTLNLNTGASAAFEATGGGTITSSGPASVLQTTTATALRVVNTTIGAAGVTFQRISSNGGNSPGIVLDSTGTLGGLRISGTGAPGSGGTIANKAGADGLLDQGIGIFLADTANVELNRMQLNDFSNFAILGSNVTGFALIDSVISGSNGSNDVIDEAAVLLTNLLGSGEITRTSISGGVEDNVRVVNDSGILDRLIISDSTFSNAARPLSNDGLRVEATGTAFVAVIVTNSTFSANRGDHFDADANGSATLDLIFTGNTLTGGHPGALGQSFILSNSQSAEVVFDVSGNTIRDSVVNAMTYFQSATSTAASSMRGAITGNTIGQTGVNGSGSSQGSGVVVNATGLGEVTVSVLNNQIRQWSNPFGLLFQAGDPGSVLNVTATGNTIQEPNLTAFPLNGLQANIGTTAAGTVNACLDIRNNTLSGSGAFGADDFRFRQRNASTVNLPGYGGAVSDTAAVVTFVQGANVGVPTGSATFSAAGGGFTGAGAACPQP